MIVSLVVHSLNLFKNLHNTQWTFPVSLSHMSVPTFFSDVAYLSHRGVSAEPLQRADQLSGGCWWCQLRRRLSVSSGRAEDRPAHPGRTAHAQWPRHGAGRPRHRGRVQDGQAVTQEADYGREQEEKKHTNLWMERNKGQDEPSPSLHGRPAVRPRPLLREDLWNDAPPKDNRGKRHPVACRGMASLSFWMRLVAQRFR